MSQIITAIAPTNADFAKGLQRLADFKNAHDPAVQRIQVVSSKALDFPIVLAPKPSFWQRLLQRIYKRKEKRLAYVVTEAIKYLEKNQKRLEEGDNLVYLRDFKTKLYTIRRLSQKVSSQTLAKLDKLIKDAETSKTNEHPLITNAKEAAKKLKEKTQGTVDEIRKKTQEIEKNSQKEIEGIKKVTEFLKKERVDIRETYAQKFYRALIDATFILEFSSKTNFNYVSRPLPEGDTIFFLPSSKTEIRTHSAFFPEFIKPIEKEAMEKAKNLGIAKYYIHLENHLPDFNPDLLKSFISFMTGAKGSQEYRITDLVHFCLYAENLKMESFLKPLADLLENYFRESPYAVLVAGDYLSKLDTSYSRVWSDLIYWLKNLPLTQSELEYLPKFVFKNIENLLMRIPKNYATYNEGLEIIDKWRGLGLLI